MFCVHNAERLSPTCVFGSKFRQRKTSLLALDLRGILNCKELLPSEYEPPALAARPHRSPRRPPRLHPKLRVKAGSRLPRLEPRSRKPGQGPTLGPAPTGNRGSPAPPASPQPSRGPREKRAAFPPLTIRRARPRRPPPSTRRSHSRARPPASCSPTTSSGPSTPS